MSARLLRRAALLRYAALQFLVLVPAAMVLYAGGSFWDVEAPGYAVTGNFLSDLGMTHAWSGRANTASAVLFSIALASVGLALIAFAWTWPDFAGRRARAAGWASAVLGTVSGVCFTGIACTPFDVALQWHNLFVIGAFALLLGYVVALAIAMARNGATAAQNLVNAAYVVLVLGYVAMIFAGPRLHTEHGFRVQVIAQKVVAAGSMLHAILMTTLLRRRMRTEALAPGAIAREHGDAAP